MDSIKLLSPPEYTAEERNALIDFVLALKKSHIQDFLKRVELSKSGTKPDLRERLKEALDEGEITYEQLVLFLDSLVPWGKQHVFLYAGPRSDMQSWKSPEYVLEKLKEHRLGKLFNAQLPLILPEKLTLSSIKHIPGRSLRIVAVQRREYTERTPEHDERRKTVEGEDVILKAYMHHMSRTLVAFEWDLDANTSILQITQLQSDSLYEEVAKEFCKLVSSWLDMNIFSAVDVRLAIRRLHALEENAHGETRSHGIHYRTLQGRRLSAHSPSAQDSVLGEPVIDQAMHDVGESGVGHLGNFYWLPEVNGTAVPNPLKNEVHMIVVGDKSRINFPTPNTEDALRYVLHRVRALSGTTS